MKLTDKLWNKHGDNLEEKSLTICSGTDYINISYQHIVCPDAETAKVSYEFKIRFLFKNKTKVLFCSLNNVHISL